MNKKELLSGESIYTATASGEAHQPTLEKQLASLSPEDSIRVANALVESGAAQAIVRNIANLELTSEQQQHILEALSEEYEETEQS